ncbi:hypothetical protein [Streptomyces sp. WM6372]|nr:hypothetical protein [Streptomyces sp. WM6372]
MATQPENRAEQQLPGLRRTAAHLGELLGPPAPRPGSAASSTSAADPA